ncbi:MAG: hypothetical protein AAF733_01425 [Verrucomicrobiota bacterium]
MKVARGFTEVTSHPSPQRDSNYVPKKFGDGVEPSLPAESD